MTKNELKKIVKKLITNQRYKLTHFFLFMFNCLGLICRSIRLPLFQMELFSIFFSFDMILGKNIDIP